MRFRSKSEEICRCIGKSIFQTLPFVSSMFSRTHYYHCGEDQWRISSSNRDKWGLAKKCLTQIRVNYNNNDIFKVDGLGLFYGMIPSNTLKFKGKKCSEDKLSKDRLTVLVAANLSGKGKEEILVIGKYRKPRCFKNV